MPNVELYSYQIDAIENLHNGCILCGGVGTGKSRTSLAYAYTKELGGTLKVNGAGKWTKPTNGKDLYIVTTAKKRDSLEWEEEMLAFGLSTDPELSAGQTNVVVDSWNNIQKYKKVYGAMFIFDEQRVVGKGAWVKAFLKIARANHWILLTATPGDTWEDYIPVFVANGFYKNRTDFNMQHIVYKPYMKYPVVDHFVNTGILLRHRRDIMVVMKLDTGNQKFNHTVTCRFDKELYRRVFKDRWDVYDDCPIEETGKLCYLLRRVTNEDPTRIEAVRDLMIENPKSIIFYNFTPELNILRSIAAELGYEVGEWNGEVHSSVPTSDRWVYLCQYTAAAEGWNCITTNVIIFYSQNYSYKTTVQAAGRIDRSNTPFKELHYYYLKSHSPIDLAIARSLSMKKNFNERDFMNGIQGNR